MKTFHITVKLTEKQYRLIHCLAATDEMTDEQELAQLCMLQVREEVELQEMERRSYDRSKNS